MMQEDSKRSIQEDIVLLNIPKAEKLTDLYMECMPSNNTQNWCQCLTQLIACKRLVSPLLNSWFLQLSQVSTAKSMLELSSIKIAFLSKLRPIRSVSFSLMFLWSSWDTLMSDNSDSTILSLSRTISQDCTLPQISCLRPILSWWKLWSKLTGKVASWECLQESVKTEFPN